MAREGWLARFRALGQAAIELYAAEMRALADDLGRSGRLFLRALALVGVAFALAFWALGLVIYLGVELLALWLPRSAAVGIVLGIFLLATLLVALAARRRFRQVETPGAAVRRRIDEHREWWQERVAGIDEALEREEER